MLGVAEAGNVVSRFGQYVESFQVTSVQPARCSSITTPGGRSCRRTKRTAWSLSSFSGRKLARVLHGESFDTFTIDDGWDNKDSIWEIRRGPLFRTASPRWSLRRGGMNAQLGLLAFALFGLRPCPMAECETATS